jgi:GT2 family glycosyltransferase
MESRLVSLVLVTWNSAPYLPRCLEGMRQQTHARTELIVVDNASVDDSATQCEAAGARVIRNAENRGFSAAVNQGIEAANGELILLVNPDCYLTPEYTARLAATLEEAGSDYGAATGLLVRAVGHAIEPTDKVDSLGIVMTRSGRHLDFAQGAPLSERPHDVDWLEVFGVSGAAAMYRRSFLDDVAVGGKAFDEDFFAYREDADLAWRGRLFGWRALCDLRAVAPHVRRVTPEARASLPASINMHSVKNRFLLRLKNQGRYLALRNAPFELVRDLLVLGATVPVETSSFAAFGWLWRNRRRILATRRDIQSRRKVSDRELARWFV